jgi:hypothetical protein
MRLIVAKTPAVGEGVPVVANIPIDEACRLKTEADGRYAFAKKTGINRAGRRNG